MKKAFISTLAVLFLALGTVSAQDLAGTTEMYNNAAAALSAGNKDSALKTFEQVLAAATALGEEGNEIVTNCKNIIPSINLSIAKDLAKEAKYDDSVAKLQSVLEIAQKFEAADVLEEAKSLIPMIISQKAASLLNSKDYTGAAAAYKQVLEADPTNGMNALRLGAALAGAGDTEAALSAFEQAAANGQEAAAKKQIANLHLKSAAAALKAKKYADAVAAAVKANEAASTPQALQIAGQASQLAGKNADAIKYFEQYLEVAPKASNAGQIAYTVGALYQTAKNNDKAKEFYTKALSDAKYGAEAKKLLDALK